MTDRRAASLGAQPSTKVAEAAQFDLQRNHERALQLLAEAAAQGDVEAMTRLGKRLLTADYAPHLPDRGTELIVRGANLGGAEAAAQVAVLAAIGMHLPQSWPPRWPRSCSPPSGGRRRRKGSCGSWPPIGNWQRVPASPRCGGGWRGSIDLNRWHLQSPTGATLHEAPLVRCFPGFVTAEVCRWLIERSRGRLVRAPVYDAVAKKETVSSTRTNTWAQFNVTHADLVSVLVQVHMCANTGVAFRQLEPLSVLHYAAGEQSTSISTSSIR